jgi:2-furoyl-CoA dehydrogenase large subunit
VSTPVCIANAVADALGVPEISLPLTPGAYAGIAKAGIKRPDAQSFQALN